MTTARALVMLVALAAFTMLIASGPGTRLGFWPWETGIALMKWAAYAGLAAAAVGFVLVLLLAVPRWRKGAWVPIVAVLLGLVAATPPVILLQQAKAAPPIHDITTDAFDPPAFVALLAERNKAPNGAAYAGPALAAQQQKGYPDIKSLLVNASPKDTMQKAIDAARGSGWEIVAMDAASGRIEATATTRWFGFKDDVVVRIRPEASGGSRVDVRSMSRVGQSDVGANAKRIREFLKALT